MLKLLITILLFPLSLFAFEFKSYPKELESAVQKIYKLPEAKKLLIQINKKGPITLSIDKNPAGKYNGMWVANTRTIYINAGPSRSQGAIIRTILFELHNALGNGFFADLWDNARKGTIDKEKFIEKAEKHEYDNLKKTNILIEEGVALNIFPKDTKMKIIPDFKTHYNYQQLAGHSQWFSIQYDRNCPPHMRSPYRGTLDHLSTLSVKDTNDLMRYFHLCRKLCTECPNKACDQAFANIESEYMKLQACVTGQAKVGMDCSRAVRKLELFMEIFKNIL